MPSPFSKNHSSCQDHFDDEADNNDGSTPAENGRRDDGVKNLDETNKTSRQLSTTDRPAPLTEENLKLSNKQEQANDTPQDVANAKHSHLSAAMQEWLNSQDDYLQHFLSSAGRNEAQVPGRKSK